MKKVIAVQVIAEGDSLAPLLCTFFRDDNSARRYRVSKASDDRLVRAVSNIMPSGSWDIENRIHVLADARLTLVESTLYSSVFFDLSRRN